MYRTQIKNIKRFGWCFRLYFSWFTLKMASNLGTLKDNNQVRVLPDRLETAAHWSNSVSTRQQTAWLCGSARLCRSLSDLTILKHWLVRQQREAWSYQAPDVQIYILRVKKIKWSPLRFWGEMRRKYSTGQIVIFQFQLYLLFCGDLLTCSTSILGEV